MYTPTYIPCNGHLYLYLYLYLTCMYLPVCTLSSPLYFACLIACLDPHLLTPDPITIHPVRFESGPAPWDIYIYMFFPSFWMNCSAPPPSPPRAPVDSVSRYSGSLSVGARERARTQSRSHRSFRASTQPSLSICLSVCHRWGCCWVGWVGW